MDRNVNWKDVEEYLKQYVNEFFEIAYTKDIVYIGSDLPDEYTNSNYTHRLKGASAKAKANAAQGLPEMIEIAAGKHFEENRKNKHSKDAKYGWYRYESRFALPVFGDHGDVERYNIFHVLMLVRHAKDGKMYLYDLTLSGQGDTRFCSTDLRFCRVTVAQRTSSTLRSSALQNHKSEAQNSLGPQVPYFGGWQGNGMRRTGRTPIDVNAASRQKTVLGACVPLSTEGMEIKKETSRLFQPDGLTQ